MADENIRETTPCPDCRGTGLRGGNGTTPEHVGRLVECTTCKGTGKVEVNAGEGAGALSTPTDGAPAERPSILQRLGLKK